MKQLPRRLDLEPPEADLAEAREYPGYRGSGKLLDLLIELDDVTSDPGPSGARDCRLPGTRQADENDVPRSHAGPRCPRWWRYPS